MNWNFSLIGEGLSRRNITKLVIDSFKNVDYFESTRLLEVLVKSGYFTNGNIWKGLLIDADDPGYWKPLSLDFQSKFRFYFKGNPSSVQPIRVVYYINCFVNADFWRLVYSQLNQLKESLLLEYPDTTMHVVLAGTFEQRNYVEKQLGMIFKNNAKIKLEYTDDNAFEYPAIHRVWELACADRNGLILYFHAKGLSHLDSLRSGRTRTREEEHIFKHVIGDWKRNIAWLSHVSTANKLAMQCGGNGWGWYNFWWARSSYLCHLEEPYKLGRRHYYEDWLGRYSENIEKSFPDMPHSAYPDTISQCLSIASAPRRGIMNLGARFEPGINMDIGMKTSYQRVIPFMRRKIAYPIKLELKRRFPFLLAIKNWLSRN